MTKFTATTRLLATGLLGTLALNAEPVLDLGSDRQLFVDDYLVGQTTDLEYRLHPPQPREIVMVRDRPWEGSGTDFERFIRDGDIIRMYYMATKLTVADGLAMGKQPVYACYAESKDGIHWERPDVGLFEFEGSKHNNIIWAQEELDNFTPFKDTNPACPADERFKATVGIFKKGLFTLKSADGIHWRPMSDGPVTTQGTFDSQNNAFWDPVRQQYWCYLRGFHPPARAATAAGSPKAGPLDTTHDVRDVRVATSKDFRAWTEPQRITFVDSPDEGLYTNQIEPYYRAPKLFVGFPTRYVDRDFSPAAMRALPDPVHRQRRMVHSHRFGTAITDGQFMSSRDGHLFHRWNETFIPPGPERNNNWVYGDGYQTLGLLETPAEDPTAPHELMFYAGEGEWKEGPGLRRYTMRIDGFVSLHARTNAGTCVTKPFRFTGARLSLNFATTAAGAVQVEIQDANGTPYPGYTLADCDELFGDTLDRTVTWHEGADLSALAGKPIRLRIELREADLYSLIFAP